MNIEDIKKICSISISEMEYYQFEKLDSIRLQIKIRAIELEKEYKDLTAQNKRTNLKDKMVKKTEDKKKLKREIESESADSIYEQELQENTAEYEYKLYKALHEEIIEKVNAYKRFATDK